MISYRTSIATNYAKFFLFLSQILAYPSSIDFKYILNINDKQKYNTNKGLNNVKIYHIFQRTTVELYLCNVIYRIKYLLIPVVSLYFASVLIELHCLLIFTVYLT